MVMRKLRMLALDIVFLAGIIALAILCEEIKPLRDLDAYLSRPGPLQRGLMGAGIGLAVVGGLLMLGAQFSLIGHRFCKDRHHSVRRKAVDHEPISSRVHESGEQRSRHEVHSARPAQRIGPNGARLTDLVIEITQWRPGYLDPIAQERADSGDRSVGPFDFPYRGGCTLVVDSDSGKVRYCISKRIGSKERLQRQRDYVLAHGMAARHSVYFGTDRETTEPLALLHRMIGAEVSS